MPTRSVLLLGATVATWAACARARPKPSNEHAALFFDTVSTSGIRQSVTVYPRSPRVGDTLYILSVVRNEAKVPITIDAEDDLAIRGSLRVRPPEDQPELRSGRRWALSPQDTTARQTRAIVVAQPGAYSLRVRHLTQPAIEAAAEIVVQPPIF